MKKITLTLSNKHDSQYQQFYRGVNTLT